MDRDEEIRRILKERLEEDKTTPAKPSSQYFAPYMRPGFSRQLIPLNLDLQPTAVASGGGGSDGKPSSNNNTTFDKPDTPAESATSEEGSSDFSTQTKAYNGCLPPGVLEKSFSQAIRDDILNTLTVSIVRRSHMLLYSEDPWSEGYSIPLLADMADKLGAYVNAVDIADLAVLTSWVDPAFEDLTIVSHPYSPPPDLDTGNHSNSGGGSRMSFFAGINRKRSNDEGDTMSEQLDARTEESAGRDDDAALSEDEGDRRNERQSWFMRGSMGTGRGDGGDGVVGMDAESGDPVLSREMMASPLSHDSKEKLDNTLLQFMRSMFKAQKDTRPTILVLKNLGDLLNTRIGYTLFTRLTLLMKKVNKTSDRSLIIVGLMHPSIFHQDMPPPGIPPFDVNPATPTALFPKDPQPRSRKRGLGDILDNLLGGGGGGGAKGISANLGVKVIQMGDPLSSSNPHYDTPSYLSSSSLARLEKRILLPLFMRVGIPPPARSVFAEPYDMNPPGFVKQDTGSDGKRMVGSLRQLLNAEQCLDRNARTIRNVCLLYGVNGLELTNEEAAFLEAQTKSVDTICADNESDKPSDNIYRRETLYARDQSTVKYAQLLNRDPWELDYRALAVMLRSLPDDIARRYFIGETFIHRWISLAQALSIKEWVDSNSAKHSLLNLSSASSKEVLKSSHLRKAWIQLLESSVAMRKGYAMEKSSEIEEAPAVRKSTSGIFALHEQVDFADIGIGRMLEDDEELYPDMSSLYIKAENVGESGNTSDKSVETDAAEPDKGTASSDAVQTPEDKTSAFRQWASVTEELDAEVDDYESGSGSSSDFSSGKGKHRGSTLSPQKRIQLAKKSLTDYEERLVGSIIDPTSIPTGFDQVCVKQETVTTLQEIITLPMLRPEYFSKGVLRRYGVSGILLFGPPGTGKTMLAKAVAKESGSVVLNIRASDIYDKYVGEGEKLAEAVFTLARKVAPCVIFIDEVDALFSARASGEESKFRRDIMNQIMSEWDGINTSRKRGATDTTTTGGSSSSSQPPPQVTVMAATNRPFDLDDAILRRLPRRILIDLPNAEERAKILAIHLQGEDLEQDVDLKALARRAESFSGSDLKNLCVTAALAALRERVREEVAGKVDGKEHQPKKQETADAVKDENDQLSVSLIEQLKAAHHSRPGARENGNNMPPIRLGSRHFDAALKKVAPSSSDRMESLVELRKWDKIYGDGAQERKRKSYSIGFTGAESGTEPTVSAPEQQNPGSKSK
ncbi:hypothetical protein GGH99_003681 [Coemansia sp. RSA 1285]|nr:hypothetical protein GGH99_003681 [Coemansia sp. RSA 1285]